MRLRFLTLPLASILLIASTPARAQVPPAPPPPPLVPLAAPPGVVGLGPAVPPAPEPKTELRSVAAVAAGAALLTGGAPTHVVGLVMMVGDLSKECENGPCPKGTLRNSAIALAGLGAIAAGIPLLIWGMREVPVRTGSVPAWVGAPGGAGWQWRF